MFFFSADLIGFYDSDFHSFIPASVIPITDAEHAEFSGFPPDPTKALGSGENGRPQWVDIPVIDIVQVSISPRQGKLALLDAGLLGGVESYINGLAGDDAIRAQIIWTSATEWRRDDPWLTQIALSLGLNDAQVDALFIAASKL